MLNREELSRKDYRLDDAMRRLAAELEEAETPAHVELAVLAEFDRVRRRGRTKVLLAAAASVAACVAGTWLIEKPPASKVEAPLAVEAESEQPFIPIPYVLPPAPYERVEVVRMKLPVSALVAAGLPLRTADPGAQAEADVIVGQDGRPRAVRLISITSFN